MAPRLFLVSLICVALCAFVSTKHVHNGNQNSIDSKNELAYDDEDGKKVVCYYGSWAVYRPGNGKFPVEEIDPFLCSHLIYGFAGLGGDNRIRSLDPYNDLKENWGKGAFLRFNALKQVNKKLKTLIAIGGWNEGSVKYSNMASNAESRRTFVTSVVEFIEKYGFDGLDFDWEYPASRGGKYDDKRNFVTLLQELKAAFSPKGYLLTAAVSAGKSFADPAYDIPQVAKYLDIINVMCYDYHGGWETRTGHNAPLYARPDEWGGERQLNVNFSINYWIASGAPRNKIVLGMGSYGRSFTLSRAEVNGIGAPAPQKGQAGPYTREGGSLGYNEICELKLRNQKMTDVWDPYYLSPYSYWDRQWVGYDSIESITIKAQYAKAMGLGGGMVWSVETDDFRGLCGNGKYPLLNAIKNVLHSPDKPALPLPNPGGSAPGTSSVRPTTSTTTTTTQRPTTTTQRPSTTQTPSSTLSTTPSTTTTTTTARPTTTNQPTPKPSTTTTTTSTPSTTTTSTTTTTATSSPSTPSTTTTTPTPTPPASSTPSSTTQDWWPHKSSTWWPQNPSTWWPQKPSGGASSEVWWSSTPAHRNDNNNPNSIAEETTPKTTVEPAGKDFSCFEGGLYRNPSSCTKFIRCVETKIEGQFQLFYHQCPDKTVFNNETKLCDWVENVPECLNGVPRYFLRGTFQTNFQIAHPENANGQS